MPKLPDLEDPLATLCHSSSVSTAILSRNKQRLFEGPLASNNILTVGNHILSCLRYHYQMLKWSKSVNELHRFSYMLHGHPSHQWATYRKVSLVTVTRESPSIQTQQSRAGKAQEIVSLEVSACFWVMRSHLHCNALGSLVPSSAFNTHTPLSKWCAQQPQNHSMPPNLHQAIQTPVSEQWHNFPCSR